MLDNTKIFDKDTHGHFDFLEDEIDCAIAGDIKFDQVLDELEKINPTTDSNIELDHIDDVIDPTVDYSESMPDVDSVSIDADTLIDAEREINFNPLDEDELIETVIDVDFIGDRGIANKLFYDNSEENDLLEEETEYNANTYNAILREALSEKAKKRLKIGAAVAAAGALGYGAYRVNQHQKNNDNSSSTQKSIDNPNPERKLLTAPKQTEAFRKNPPAEKPVEQK